MLEKLRKLRAAFQWFLNETLLKTRLKTTTISGYEVCEPKNVKNVSLQVIFFQKWLFKVSL